jgi:hypothetical protein
LHAHVVDDPVFELDVRVTGGDLASHFQEEPVGELHDVRLVDGRDLATFLAPRVLEGEAGYPLAAPPGDDLDRLGRIPADHMLDPGIEILGVLANHHQVDVLVPRLDARDADRRS